MPNFGLFLNLLYTEYYHKQDTLSRYFYWRVTEMGFYILKVSLNFRKDSV